MYVSTIVSSHVLIYILRVTFVHFPHTQTGKRKYVKTHAYTCVQAVNQ